MFNLNSTSLNTASSKFIKADQIVSVTLKSVKPNDITSKDGSNVYKTIEMIFEDAEGATFKHTIWEPKPEGFQRRTTETANGTLVSPSDFETTQGTIMHILKANDPATHDQIVKGTKSINAPTWEAYRLQVSALFKTQGTFPIKLLGKTNAAGYTEAIFPRYAFGIKNDLVVIKNKFAGEGLVITPYEQTKIDERKEATTPTAGSTFTDNKGSEFGNLNFGSM